MSSGWSINYDILGDVRYGHTAEVGVISDVAAAAWHTQGTAGEPDRRDDAGCALAAP